MEKNYLMVRAMNSNESDFEIFFKNHVVAVGWSEIDFTLFDKTETRFLLENIEEKYYQSPEILPQVLGRQLNQVKRFHNISAGDSIIIPYYNSIRLAIAKDEILFDENAYDSDLSNQRKVEYLFAGKTFKTIPRDSLSEALQRRLRVRGSTVLNLYEFKEEIDKLFSKESYSWTSDFEEKENDLKNIFKNKLIQNIKSGKTGLKTGGIGLERLIKELFECEGYKSEVLAKTAFDVGDADVSAVKSDRFQEIKVLIQVKHHSGYTNDWGISQLNEIKKNQDYRDHKFVLITSANIGAEVKNYAEKLGVVTMDGDELCEWIIENLNKLSIETKIILGISSIPQLTI